MITISICDPNARGPFKTFVHNTTTYVAVPHDAASQLWVEADEPSMLVIQSCGGQPVIQRRFERQIAVPLSEIKTPANYEPGLADFVKHSLLRRQLPPHRTPNHRLYDFTAEVKSLRTGSTSSSCDVHILCPVDFALAQELHVHLQSHPSALVPDEIWQHSEGKACPQCAHLGALLKQE